MRKFADFRNALRYIISIFFSFFLFVFASAQTLGGSTAYNFLKLSPSPLLTAAGGIEVSYKSPDAGPAFQNPALLSPEMQSQLSINFTRLLAGINGYNLAGVYYNEQTKTTFGGGVFFIDYGRIQQTDAAGNVYGTFKASDYNMQFSASKKYLERWQYGITAKFIHSSYQQFQSIAIAADAGVLYVDSSRLLNIAVVAKNMGVPVKSYNGKTEELPFDLQIGFTKKLQKAPFGFSLTAHHLHQFNLFYRDTAFNNANNFDSKINIGKKLFSHFVIATHIYIGTNMEAIIGYNRMKRDELSIGPGSGLSGFSGGFAARFKKMHITYAHSTYQKNISSNQLGLNLFLNAFLGLGQ